LLVALILSARTRDEVVNAITPELFRRYRTAADWANEKPEVLYKRLRPVNFPDQGASHSTGLPRAGGEIRRAGARPEDLLTLLGVGRKTANALLGNAFGSRRLPWTLT
jgi:endonuclease-3